MFNINKIKITNTNPGSPCVGDNTKIEIDGVELTGVIGLTYEVGVGEIGRLILEMNADIEIDSNAILSITKDTLEGK
jgi:hypothetical protein